jgi:hypothetical protein
MSLIDFFVAADNDGPRLGGDAQLDGAPQDSERVRRMRRFAVHVGAYKTHRAEPKATDDQVASNLKSLSTPDPAVAIAICRYARNGRKADIGNVLMGGKRALTRLHFQFGRGFIEFLCHPLERGLVLFN